jgi:hypothetical protein
MSLLTIRILFFCLVPLGIFLLIKGIRLLRKSFTGELLLEISLEQKEGDFLIAKQGEYAIWQKGKIFMKTPLASIRPVIYDNQSKEAVHLYPAMMRIRSNSFSKSQMEIYTFHATPGNYSLKLERGSSISAPEKFITGLIPAKEVEPSEYFILIREKQPVIYLVAGILMTILSAGCLLCGIIFGTLAEQLFPNIN